MSKMDNIICYDKYSGECIDNINEISESVLREEYNNRLLELQKIFNDDPNNMSLEEIIELRKYKRKSTKDIKVRIDFTRVENEVYFTVKDNSNIEDNMDLVTLGAIKRIGVNITHNGFVTFKNNHAVRSLNGLKELVGASDYVWKNTIWKSLKQYDVVIKEKIRGEWFIVMNPLFQVKNRVITEYMFICFHKELKKYIDELDYIYLIKFYKINPEG